MLRDGMKVRLKPFEDQPEQRGTVVADEDASGTVLVVLDDQYIDEEDDDGIREVPVDQVEVLD